VYKLIKFILFKINPESAHKITFGFLHFIFLIPFVKLAFKKLFIINDKSLCKNVFGVKFKNPVGLAAGFDKDAKHIEVLDALGFGFIEIGTITPKSQPGNDKPRLFRLPLDHALINRMGFNNDGVDVVYKRLKSIKNKSIVIGANIGKNKLTPNESAVNDYIICFEKLFDVVDYFVVNVSSPNTPGLRSLQEKEPLKNILLQLQKINSTKENQKPILLKIAPDLTYQQLDDIIEIVTESKIAGIVATNTTTYRDGLKTNNEIINSIGVGGLSGLPLKDRSTDIVRYLNEIGNNKFVIIGVGGIHSEQDAIDKISAGAELVQLYTGFVYNGPSLIKKINKQLIKYKNANRDIDSRLL